MVLVDVGASYHRAWQHARLKETEAKDCGFAYLEDAIIACHTIRGSRSASVQGIAQSTTLRNGYACPESFGEDFRIDADNWFFKTKRGKVAIIVRRTWCRLSCVFPILIAV